MGLDFTTIDVETANADRSSICQIGIVQIREGTIVDQWESLVDPEDWFDDWNVKIHGIQESEVEGAPTFPDLIPELKRLLSGTIVVSHSSFDRVALERAEEKYHLEPMAISWLDSAKVARRVWPGEKGYGLKKIAQRLGIEFKHHDALEDAKATAAIVLRSCHESGLSIEEWETRQYGPIYPDRSKSNSRAYIAAQKLEGNAEGELYGETIVFTGSLSIPRKEVVKLAQMSGSNVRPGVTKKTSLLVVGIQDKHKLAGYKKSSKHRKAETLISQGHEIQLLSEADFYALIKHTPPPWPQRKEKPERRSRGMVEVTFTLDLEGENVHIRTSSSHGGKFRK